jgi:hypothetical protein
MQDQTTQNQPQGHRATIGRLLSEIFTKFIWDDLKSGRINLKGLPVRTWWAVWLGFLTLGLLLILMMSNEVLNKLFPNITINNSVFMAPGRGLLISSAMAPIIMVGIILAWSYLLTGALRAHWAIRFGVLAIYLMTSARQMISLILYVLTIDLQPVHILVIVLELLIIAIIPFLFLLLHFTTPQPAIEFGLMIIFVGFTFFIPQLMYAISKHQTGNVIGPMYLQLEMTRLLMLITPMLIKFGYNIADFTRQTTRWAGEAINYALPSWGPGTLLAVFLIWRLTAAGRELIERLGRNGIVKELLEYGGALGVVLCVGLVWWLLERLCRADLPSVRKEDQTVVAIAKLTIPIIVLYLTPNLISYFLNSLANIIFIPVFVKWSLKIESTLLSYTQEWMLIFSTAVFLTSLWFARRGRATFSLYLGLFGLLEVYHRLTQQGSLLDMLYWQGDQPVQFWWLILVAGISILLLIKKQLTKTRAVALFFIAFTVFLVSQRDFIENPFSIFGFAGVGFIAFGMVWDVMTKGQWVNRDSPTLSRNGRIFLYVGYALLTAVVVNWTLVTHHHDFLEFVTGDGALGGFDRFGIPMIYMIFLITLADLFSPKNPMEANGLP